MPEINANIVVQPYNIDINLTQPGITVTPDVTSLNIYAVGGTNGVPGGNVGDLQYYAANGFGGIPSNVANYTGSTLNLNVNSTKISGGTNGYVLQTDGAGNISWTAQTGGGGNGSPGGSNTQIQYNDNGLFGGSTGFTFNKSSNLVSMPGALTITGDLTGNNANFTGNITAYTVTANLNGSATTASTVTANAQPNITSVGTLTGANISGVLNASVLRTNDTEIALGLDAGATLQDTGAVALGVNAGFYAQGSNAVAISYDAGRDSQGDNSIAIGANAAFSFQGPNSIAIGVNAGSNGQATNSIAIGTNAAPNLQPTNSIVINATGANLDAGGANRFYVKPIRSNIGSTVLFYDGTTGEITYGVPSLNDATLTGNTSMTGNANVTNNFNVGGTANIVGNLTTTGTTTVQQIKEKVSVSGSGATGTINYDLLNGAIVLNTANATANFTLNFRGNSSVTLNNVMSSNESITCTFINTNGAVAYLPTQLQVDGTNVTPLWSSLTGPAPGTSNGKDMYVFNIIKTAANTYSVFASTIGYI